MSVRGESHSCLVQIWLPMLVRVQTSRGPVVLDPASRVCRVAVFHPFQAWGYTPFVLVWLYDASTLLGVSFQPWQSVVSDGRISPHLFPLSFFPGCPE